MTYLEAAVTVLRASGRPLTIDEIMERILSEGLVPMTGRTPRSTLSAALYRNLGKHPELRRLAKHAQQRAHRGSVRWTLAS